MIVHYPESSEGFQDLHVCFGKTELRKLLIQDLKEQNRKRLLQPGANTKDIIDQYISMIRCLRLLDPTGFLLSHVAEPVRSYLRLRPDTIRCIMTALINGSGDLADELAKPFENGHVPADENLTNVAEDFNNPEWVPDPVDAPPGKWMHYRLL